MYNPAKEHGLPKRGKQFEAVGLNDQQRNQFNMSYDKRGTYNFNHLYCVGIEEALAGDTWDCKRSAIAKAAPMLAPIYHRVNIYFHTVAVPLRILWNNFEKMRSVGDGTQSLNQAQSYTAPSVPTFTLSRVGDDVLDYTEYSTPKDLLNDPVGRHLIEMGIPAPFIYTENGGNLKCSLNMDRWGNSTEPISILPFRAYYKAWYDLFRDQNNYSSPEPQTTDVITTSELENVLQMRNRAWEHDYFTSALLTPQRGPAVSFGISGSSFTGSLAFNSISFNGAGADRIAVFGRSLIDGRRKLTFDNDFQTLDLRSQDAELTGTNLEADNVTMENVIGITREGDNGLSGALDGVSISLSGGSVTIESLRQAARLQEFLERQARCGSRYTEFLLAQFGVISSDARLQRAEYIAGGSMPLEIGSVINQSEDNTGSYSGLGTAANATLDKFSYYCEEDCYILTFLSILPATGYSQGLRRLFSRINTFDFAIPAFAQLGEQEVKMKEIFFTDNEAQNEATFGYQSRYQDYKYNFDKVSGEMLTNLNSWTLSRFFTSAPTLGYSFIQEPGLAPYRSFQDTSSNSDHFYIDIWNDQYVKRKLPEFNVPKL